MDGLIDEIALYKRLLTTGERTWLYANGRGRSYAEVNPAAPKGWVASGYTYSTVYPHAVASVTHGTTTNSYGYDQNGNTLAPGAHLRPGQVPGSAGVTCRVEEGVTFVQSYNAENRLSKVQKLATGTCAEPLTYEAEWDFAYDGDGTRTATLATEYVEGVPQPAELTQYYFEGVYEVTNGAVRKYYAIAGQMLATYATQWYAGRGRAEVVSAGDRSTPKSALESPLKRA